jgi:hypothetical protein
MQRSSSKPITKTESNPGPIRVGEFGVTPDGSDTYCRRLITQLVSGIALKFFLRLSIDFCAPIYG